MKTSPYSTNCDCSSSQIQNGYCKITSDYKLRFAAIHPTVEKTKGTVIILGNYKNVLEEYFPVMREMSQRNFDAVIFDWSDQNELQSKKQKKKHHDYFDINSNLNNLDIFLNEFVYSDFPQPYYMLTYGMGGLIALSGLELINHKFNRMLSVSPFFAPLGHQTNGFQHKLTQIFSDIGLGFLPVKSGKQFKQTRNKNIQLRPHHKVSLSSNRFTKPLTSRWIASVLNTIDIIKTNMMNDHLQTPTLFILANQNNIANNIEVRKLCQYTHRTESITITGAELDTIIHSEYYRKQFWAIFDAFIPGIISSAQNFSKTL
ncbi:serine aminopeptidase domain-containing protein [Bartonella sp. F02]|uniref:serine aminopeptidase domain-containing protein n=1 Tax=Bartonella sp. F02 TaxID=2967262 RepID=UPI0022A96998|nr:alpha/beta hydrolase [Bartonella sp. F02]MCZ2328339.1 alpha/beta hydrolase [Bartonella sp. F02]